jgi:hypothetical protein
LAAAKLCRSAHRQGDRVNVEETLELPERTYNVDYEVRDDLTGKLFGLSPGDMALAMR